MAGKEEEGVAHGLVSPLLVSTDPLVPQLSSPNKSLAALEEEVSVLAARVGVCRCSTILSNSSSTAEEEVGAGLLLVVAAAVAVVEMSGD